MPNSLEVFLHGVTVFFVIYLLFYTTYLFLSVMSGAVQLYSKKRRQRVFNELKHEYYVPISILVPAYDEEVTIVDSVKSLLSLKYKLYEIIVIDDGSKDKTSEEIIKAFDLHQVHHPFRRILETKPIKEIYERKIGNVMLTLAVKENGGKGDALNAGINLSSYPYFLSMDADGLLQEDSLEKIAQAVLEDDTIVAVGGLIQVAQCISGENGKITGYHMPLNPVIGMQAVEYDRSFLASRILMDGYNGNLIISGAFGLFKKDIVLASS